MFAFLFSVLVGLGVAKPTRDSERMALANQADGDSGTQGPDKVGLVAEERYVDNNIAVCGRHPRKKLRG